ncbi:MAG TPA: cyclic nucleotide-binding domain-containing protein [Gaiellaceae bacterium]|jgi:CRP-like cAMP-binding protein|nr:cyclic nucleotide-binding domain-containing protein [Gaiellaceae bacterium]
MNARIEALRRVPLFAELGDDELAHLAEAVNEVEVPPGQLLVQPGTAGSGMFFIADGVAVVETKRGEIELGSGQFFGELALMSEDATRTARVQAKTELRCLALDRASFRALVAEHPEVAATLLEVALGRLAENAGVGDS